MKKKRVILSVTNDLSNDQRVHRIALTLQEAGFDVLVVGRKYGDSPQLDSAPYQVKRMRLLFRSGKMFYLEHAFRLFWFLLFRKADILNANDLDTLLANFLVSKLKGCRLVYDSHEYFTEVPELADRPGTRKIWLKLERWVFPKLKFAYTVNTSIAEIYAEKYKVPVGRVRNLPLLKAFPDTAQKADKLLIYQGALNLARGVDIMIRALEFLPGYHLWICGKGDKTAELKELVATLNLGERVTFKGAIPFRQLHEITCKAVLGFSLEADLGENYRLALPNKLFDYVQAGVPVLISELKEMKRIVDDYEVGEYLSMEERTPERVAEKVREICESKEKWQQFYMNCQQAATQLCWEAEKESLLRFYR